MYMYVISFTSPFLLISLSLLPLHFPVCRRPLPHSTPLHQFLHSPYVTTGPPYAPTGTNRQGGRHPRSLVPLLKTRRYDNGHLQCHRNTHSRGPYSALSATTTTTAPAPAAGLVVFRSPLSRATSPPREKNALQGEGVGGRVGRRGRRRLGRRAGDMEGPEGELGRGEGVLGTLEGVPGVLSSGGGCDVRSFVGGETGQSWKEGKKTKETMVEPKRNFR